MTAVAKVERVTELTDMEKATRLFGSRKWAKGKNYCVLI